MSLSSQTTSPQEKRYWIFYGTFFRKEDAITLESRNWGYVFQVSFIGVKSDIIKYHSSEDEYFIFNDLVEVIE